MTLDASAPCRPVHRRALGMSRWRLVGLGLLLAAVLPITAGCSSGQGDAAAKLSPNKSASPSEPHSSATEKEPVKVPPELDGAETLAGRQGETRGSRTLSYDQGRKGDALIVAVRCEGEGEMKVSLKPVRVSFDLECVEGEASTTYNQLSVAGVEKAGAVSVTAPSSVRWSLTIGRGEPPQQEG